MAYEYFKTADVRCDAVVDLPASGSYNGQTAWVDDTDELYAWDGSAWQLIGPSGGGSFAPDDAEYIVASAHAGLSAERVATDTATINVDNGTAGQTKWEVIDDSITPAKLDNGGALTVLGRSVNSSGDRADIAGSTVGHVLQVAPGPVIAFGLSTGNGPDGSAYSPDREPLTGLDTSRSDNFNGSGQQTWTNINSGPTSDTILYDVATMAQATEARNARGRYVSGPGAISADFSIFTKITAVLPGNFASSGIMLLANGTWAAPTSLVFNYMARDSGSGFGAVFHQTRTSFAGASTPIASFGNVAALISGLETYLWVRYVASTKVATCFVSWSGMPNSWSTLVSSTLANHPDIARVVDAQGSTALTANFHWWRVFVSGVNSATADQYANGVCGS